MRTVLRFVASRYGLAGLAALAVIVAVLIGRLLGLGGGSSDSGGQIAGQGQAGRAAASSTESPEPNDAPTAAPSKADPVVKPGEDGPLVVAKDFATAYLASDGAAKAWRDSLTKYATSKLAAEITTMDPATVPAQRMTGDPTLGDHGATWADVTVPTESGTLVFRLISGDKAWQVDGIDWDPKR